jgi:hypothetical protein
MMDAVIDATMVDLVDAPRPRPGWNDDTGVRR